jgi:uncharacterized protein YndB with AHSA1/START domain
VIIERSILIARPREEVFDFVSDPRSDPIWCPKVKSVEPLDPTAPGPAARFLVVHRPVPLRPPRRMEHTLVAWDPPKRIDWLEDDGHDRIEVTYTLDLEDGATRFTQRDDAELGAPRLLQSMMRAGIAADISSQLRRLRRHLERR